MKKTLFLFLLVLLTAFAAQAQDNFYRWSVDLGVGVNYSPGPYAEGYSQGLASPQVNAGIRYMFNRNFGMRVSGGYMMMNPGGSSAEFGSTYMRGSLEGVVDVGNLFSLFGDDSKFGLLLHGGAGASQANYDELLLQEMQMNQQVNNPDELEQYVGRFDSQAHLILGITPQYQWSRRIALFADLSVIQNFKQTYTLDGTAWALEPKTSGMGGQVVTVSVGVTIFLGGEERRGWCF